MNQRVEQHAGRSGALRAGLFLSIGAAACALLCVISIAAWEGYRRTSQVQNDAHVARVWLIGTTFGNAHHIRRGTSLQKWLNSKGITFLGDYEELQSQFSFDPGSAEFWFNYESYLIGQPDLECHRIRQDGTAFIDDLGQPYHGLLDIHGRTVGVYLPGYDHAAGELKCIVRWMPRRPNAPFPVSRPMVFTVRLPRTHRILPPAAGIGRAAIATASGVTIRIDAARLGPFKPANGAIGQRDLTFRVRLAGGEIANDNVATEYFDQGRLLREIPLPRAYSSIRIFSGVRSTLPTLRANLRPSTMDGLPLTITDPYGITLNAPGARITPLTATEARAGADRGEGFVLTAPLNGAGRGTDLVKIHLDVRPIRGRLRKGGIEFGTPLPFDLLVPVQTGDEI